uniref:Uncharacterized protein n=1 Tax=viral metagenome TaxID=1070528 RepID=A0A6C0HJ03_9ZZZZ
MIGVKFDKSDTDGSFMRRNKPSISVTTVSYSVSDLSDLYNISFNSDIKAFFSVLICSIISSISFVNSI